MIDTLKYTKDLEKSGLNRRQAETIVGAQFKMISENVATKSDVNNLKIEMHSEFKDIRSEFRSEFKDVRSEFKDVHSEFKNLRSEIKAIHFDLSNVESRLTLKFIGVMAMMLGLSTALNKLFS